MAKKNGRKKIRKIKPGKNLPEKISGKLWAENLPANLFKKKNPEKISDARSNKPTPRNQQDGKPKKRRSVIKRLHQKQIAIARRSGKPIPKYLDQEMERKRG